jgi:acetoin utilization deacetylase AcuC-like enzyme
MHDATYRLPLELGPGMGFDPRRPDLTLWCLEALHGLRGARRLTPTRISWARLARVHDGAWLEALTHDEVVWGSSG